MENQAEICHAEVITDQINIDSDTESLSQLDCSKEKWGNISEAVDCEIPALGMTFDNDKDAYHYYNSYARSIGFSVRIQRTNCNKRGVIRKVVLCCSCEGFYSKKTTPQKKKRRKKMWMWGNVWGQS